MNWREQEKQRHISMWDVDSYVNSDGIARWKSNDRVPPKDIVDHWAEAGFVTDVAAHDKARDTETMAFLADYAANYKGPSEEERFEARAAFGPGETVVNVLTGHKWRT